MKQDKTIYRAYLLTLEKGKYYSYIFDIPSLIDDNLKKNIFVQLNNAGTIAQEILTGKKYPIIKSTRTWDIMGKFRKKTGLYVINHNFILLQKDNSIEGLNDIQEYIETHKDIHEYKNDLDEFERKCIMNVEVKQQQIEDNKINQQIITNDRDNKIKSEKQKTLKMIHNYKKI